MEYEAIPKFKVYILTDTGANGFAGRVYGFTNEAHKDFDTYDDALNWIQVNGDRHIEYTILEVLRKP